MRRSRLQIYIDILELLTKKKLKKTHVIMKANISSTYYNEYLGHLKKLGFVKEKDRELVLTNKGYDWLVQARIMLSEVELGGAA